MRLELSFSCKFKVVISKLVDYDSEVQVYLAVLFVKNRARYEIFLNSYSDHTECNFLFFVGSLLCWRARNWSMMKTFDVYILFS